MAPAASSALADVPTFDALSAQARARLLTVLGGIFSPETQSTLLLLGPDEPHFWPAFTQSPEWQQRAAHPVDAWSERVITDWANSLNGTAYFPFTGPPYHPFYQWALDSGAAHVSPARLLVHGKAGLFVSFRGAIELAGQIICPAPPPSPCTGCERPCLSSCPVGAFQDGAYDVPKCRAYLATPAGSECLDGGCLARRACPAGAGFGRHKEQSAYHLGRFVQAK